MQSPSIEKWKQLISSTLSHDEILQHIKSALGNDNPVASDLEQHKPNQRKEEKKQTALQLLRNKGIVDSILSSVLDSHLPSPGLSFPASINLPTNNYGSGALLFVELLQGRAFIDHWISLRDCEDEEQGKIKSSLLFFVAFGCHRFRSKSIPCVTEPNIQEFCALPLCENNATPTPQQILALWPVPLLHLVVVSRDCTTNKNQLIASKHFDWRPHLLQARENKKDDWSTVVALELQSAGPDTKLTAGILDLRLRLIWPTLHTTVRQTAQSHEGDGSMSSSFGGNLDNGSPGQPPSHLSPSILKAQLSLERARKDEREQAFNLYVRQWWRDFTQLRDGAFAQRNVKMFAVDENSVTQFVCSFVRPLFGGRLLETPNIAARFVASIPCEPWHGIGSGPREQWCTGLAFVARNSGDVSDHTNLLCSLLLGFGLEAYVAVGTRRSSFSSHPTDVGRLIEKGEVNDVGGGRHHAWVVVLQPDQPDVVLFWESVSGRRYQHFIGKASSHQLHSYNTIGCLYNHAIFYANVQPTDQLVSCRFNLLDESQWRPMSPEVIATVTCHSSVALTSLCAPSSYTDPIELSNRCAASLRNLATEWRSIRVGPHSSWRWDERLGQLLTPIIAGFESDQLRSIQESNITEHNDAQISMLALRRYVPEGYTFKAYPIQVLHINSRRAFHTCLRARLCRDILDCRGEDVRLGIHARVYTYAEEALVVWIMFACMFKPVT